jgi:hypothetical protein
MFWSHYTSNCSPVSCHCPAKGYILSAAKTACVHMETSCITVACGQQFSYTWASYVWSTGTLYQQLTPGQQWDVIITIDGQQLHKVKWPTASSCHGHITHCQQLHMASSCTRSCYTLPTVTHGQQLYMVMLRTANSYAWPTAAHGHVIHCQQLNQITWWQ